MKKTIPQTSLTGQKGVNLIERIVLEMGFLWYPTQGIEAGIDGIIEIRDSVTGEVSNLILQLQSKATTKPFPGETKYGFDYTCDTRDLEYWLRGNAPVILIVSRPDTNEAYWTSVKDYFSSPDRRGTHKIHFDKERDRFDKSCRAALISLALPKDSGIYFTPPPKKETLYSNLLRVSKFPEFLFVARTTFRTRREVWETTGNIGQKIRSEWTIRSNSVFSFTDLDIAPWQQLCDLGTLECFDASKWAYSDDIDRRWVFVELLNYSLREEARNLKLRFNKQQECYYFEATPTLRPRQITYQSISNKTSRTVFRGYPNTENPRYYRHSAFKAKFQLYDNAWYLELVPTYYFTWDGYKTDHFYEDRLKGIKRLESNSAVLGQLIMWSEYLSRKDLMDDGHQLIEFDGLLSFELDSGIDETLWLHNEEPYAKELLSSTEPLLF